MHSAPKTLLWIGSAKKDLTHMPDAVQDTFGYALHLAQIGKKSTQAKPLSGFGGAGVLEVIEDDVSGTYRAVYTVKFEEAVFVLHVFQKKSKRGIDTPVEDMSIIRHRLKIAAILAQELRDEKTNH